MGQPINRKDLDVELNYRDLADRYDFEELHAFYDEYLRLTDVRARIGYNEIEVARLRHVAAVYQQAIEFKQAEGTQ